LGWLFWSNPPEPKEMPLTFPSLIESVAGWPGGGICVGQVTTGSGDAAAGWTALSMLGPSDAAATAAAPKSPLATRVYNICDVFPFVGVVRHA
jgi:hypothetical protein